MTEKKAPIRKALRRLDPAKCSGRWSVCRGANPRVGPNWGLCEACTAKRAAAMKKAKAAKVVPIVSRKPPAPKREPAARAAMVSVEPTVTKTK